MGLGLSLEGLQGKAELSPWEGLGEGENGVLEIFWASPGKIPAQGQSVRLLGRLLVRVVRPKLPKTYP